MIQALGGVEGILEHTLFKGPRLSVIFLEFLNFNFVKMASTRRHAFMKPSTRL